jgi:PAS domain S-box-containing protein
MSRLPWFGADGESGLSEVLWEDGERVYCRTWRNHPDGTRREYLAVVPAGEHPAPGSIHRLTHEYELREFLDAAWALRPLELVREHGTTMLLLEYHQGKPLLHRIGPRIEIEECLRLAVALSASVGRLHERGLVHKDIKPANILVDSATAHVWLTGFGIASRLRRELPLPEPPEFNSGTLAYMAPEQTGHMNRSIDSRSDLYSLGITLYQMLTGELPFTATEPGEWVHCHIAKKPQPSGTRFADVPEPVSDIVMKLLSKIPEERYQTATGLEADLRRCMAEWQSHGRIESFPLGAEDLSDRLLIPEKLYGREDEVDALLAAFDRVVAGGRPELVLVSGYSGVGKSAVVNELHQSLVPPRGLFASGKFDQYKRDIPYATVAQAFQSLIRPLLRKPEAELSKWRDDLDQALSPNGFLLLGLVPELKLIIGEQLPVAALGPQEAKARSHLAFRRFLTVFARREHPLALFLDDLQWLDAATVDFLEDLLVQQDLPHLLVAGAYRDNEVDSAHPLIRMVSAIRQAGAPVEEIRLTPLGANDLAHLIADSLHCELHLAMPLALLIHQKTAGNPFFAIQFIQALVEEGLITFEYASARWRWDLDAIHAKRHADNVVDLMVSKLNRLPVTTQKALQQFACIGNRAEAATLSVVLETTEQETEIVLWQALHQELTVCSERFYRFAHDRIQEAAYSSIAEGARAESHLRIGRLLLAHTHPEKRGEAIFEIVSQFNRGARLISSESERLELAALNLAAGKRAKTSTAYASALQYFIAGEALLAKNRWERHHDLIFELELHRAECEFLTGELAAADERLTMLSSRTANTVERATVECLRIDLFTVLEQPVRAVAACLDYLRHLGIAWLVHPTEEQARSEYERIWSQLGSREIEEVIDFPLMDDPTSIATLDVLTKVLPAALFTDPNLVAMVICRAMSISIERGNSDGSCVAYVFFGKVAGPRFGDYKAGFRFAQLGYELVEKRGLVRFQARTSLWFAEFVLPWTKHIRDRRELMQRAMEAATKVGDLTVVGYSLNNLNANFLAAGDPLAETQLQAERGLKFAEKMKFSHLIDVIATQLGLTRTLRGLTYKFGCFDDGQIREALIEEHFMGNPAATLPECWYWIRKLQARFFAGDYPSALDAAARAQPILWTSAAMFETAEYHFYAALAHAASCTPAEYQQHVEPLLAHHRQLEEWAEDCPENFADRAALVGAELARVQGRELDAERMYERAIRSASESNFVHNEALANELAAGFHRDRGLEKVAIAYWKDARYLYARWGADGKVAQLDERYPRLRAERTPATPVGQLDVATVVKASQAISSEMILPRLIEKLMRIAVEHAGAERGLLILIRSGEPRIEAEASTGSGIFEVAVRQVAVTSSDLPPSALHYVMRTQESVLLDDASRDAVYARDEYVVRKRSRSVLCLPIVKQKELVGALYLENNLAPFAFTPDRVAVLQLLASQAAISLENATLYSDLQLQAGLLQRLPVSAWTLKPDGTPDFVNGVWLEYSGQTLDFVRSHPEAWMTAVHPEDRDATARAFWEGIRSGQGFAIETRSRRARDGAYRRHLQQAVVLRDAEGNVLRFVGTTTDIDDQKQADEKVRNSEAVLAESQRLSLTGSFTWRAVTDEITWSVQLSRIFEFDQAEPVTFERICTRVYAEDLPAFKEQIEQSRRDGSDMEQEFRLQMPDRSLKYLHVVAHNRGDRDQPDYVGAVQDVTQRRLSEEALTKARSELAHVVRVTSLGMMTASIAHEVNQPLSGIITNAGTCLRMLNADPPNFDGARETARRTIRDGNRASDVITRLRTLYSKKAPLLEQMDLNEAAREVIALLLSELQANGALLQPEFADRLPMVQGDRVQLQQVILNLVRNASDAMRDIEDRPRRLLIRTEQAGKDACFTVQDSGIGFDSAIGDRLFESFYTTKPEGMGIGLSVSRSIIEAHGGRMWAVANDGTGATFGFSLPCG